MTSNEETPGRGPNGDFTRTVETAEREAEACRLRSRSWSYQQIADELGYANRSAAYKAVKRGLLAVVKEPAEGLVQLQLDRLDAMAREVLAIIDREHLVSSAGRLVLGQDGNPVRDDSVRLQAIDRLLKIEERRAKLLGLDSATKVEVKSSGGLDEALRELETELRGPVVIDAPVETK